MLWQKKIKYKCYNPFIYGIFDLKNAFQRLKKLPTIHQ